MGTLENETQASLTKGNERIKSGIENTGNHPLSMVVTSISRLEIGLYFSLLLETALPSIYSTVRISLLGEFTSDNGVNIVSQVNKNCNLLVIFIDFLGCLA